MPSKHSLICYNNYGFSSFAVSTLDDGVDGVLGGKILLFGVLEVILVG